MAETAELFPFSPAMKDMFEELDRQFERQGGGVDKRMAARRM